MPTASPAASCHERAPRLGPPLAEPRRRREVRTASRPPASTRVRTGTHAWWPCPGLFTQDSAVPGGLAAGAGDKLTRASSRPEPCGRFQPRSRAHPRRLLRIRGALRAQAQASWRAGPGGTTKFRNGPKARGYSSAPRRHGRVRLKSKRSSAPTLAGCRAAPNRPCRAPLPLPRPWLPGRSPDPAHAALCTCPWASTLSRPRSFCCWRQFWAPHPSLRLEGGRVSGERAAVKHLRVASTMSTSFPTPLHPRSEPSWLSSKRFYRPRASLRLWGTPATPLPLRGR